MAMRGWTAHARGIATQPVAAGHGSDGDDSGGGHGDSAGSDGSSGAAMRPASWPGWSYVAQPDRAAGPGLAITAAGPTTVQPDWTGPG